MFEVNIKVEPQNSSDMQRALEFILDQPCMSKFKEIYDNKSSYLTGNLAGNSRNNQELIDKIKELEKKIEEEAKSQLETLKKEYNKNLTDKDKEISRLRKMLESYSVSFGSDDHSEKIYFEVSENGTLEESMISSDSLYWASKSGSIYKFTINTDDGPMIKAISDVNRYLIPYCDIQNQIEGANTILILSIGEAKLIGGSFQVEKKAVISLIKQ